MKFNYYSLQYGDQKGDGQLVEFDQVVEDKRRESPKLFHDPQNPLLTQEIETVDPIFERNPTQWQRAFSTAIFVITGCVPDKLDKKQIKRAVFDIKNHSKDNPVLEALINSRRFVFGTLPYLIAGFNFTNKGLSQNGNNNIKNLLATIEMLANDADFTTFFCAHREHAPEMVTELDADNIRRSCRLALGIRNNIAQNRHSKSGLRIIQPAGTPEGLAAVFPEIFLNYLRQGKLADLMLVLSRHFIQLGEVVGQEFNEDVTTEDTTQHVKETLAVAERKFGDWKNTSMDRCDCKRHDEGGDPLIGTLRFTADEISRLMPYYKEGLSISQDLISANLARAKELRPSNPDLPDKVAAAITEFLSIRTSTAKAIYETAFYYAWGERARNGNSAIIGLERDHDLFQTLAIVYGFNKGEIDHYTRHKSPSIFAKRKSHEDPTRLSGLSFRQFWRLSERPKFESRE